MYYMMRIYSYCLLCCFFILCLQAVTAQTSWKGTSGTSWKTASNWTAGIPTSSTDAIIGDANFTGPSMPYISGSAACKSLTLGGGARAVTLSMSRNLTVSGNLTINSNGTFSQGGTTVTVTGDWSNSGTYTTSSTSSNVVFAGVTQSLGGSSTTTFRKLTVNVGSTLTLARNVVVSGSGSLLTVKGTLNPGTSPGFLVTASALTVNANAILLVNAATFAGNYTVSGTVTLNAASTVNYSGTIDQTVSNTFTYGTLRISGSGTKSLTANLPALASSSGTYGNIYVAAGTLDLQGFTANRGTTVSGGTFTVANSAGLKIGGTNTFPANYTTKNLSLTSTVEYSGANQAVAATTYGNLTLSSSAGAAIKTFPATALTISGNLTSTQGAGTSVSFTAGAALAVSGNVVIGASTTFDGGSYTHSFAGNWTNNGTFTGNTSTATFTGGGSLLSGSGVNNFNNLTITGSNITAAAATAVTVAGNLATTGAGNFTHLPGGTTTLSGTTKTITGTGFVFDNLGVTGTVTTSSSLSLTGNLTVSGSLTTSAGTFTISGAAKTISGTGTKTFSSLNVSGTVSTGVNFTISGALNVSGSLTATAGTATFTGTSTLNGTANLFNVTLNGTSMQLSSNAVLGIAGAYTLTAGTLNVTSAIPNTVNFNGSGAQNVNGGTYYHLTVSNGGTKTALAAITTNGSLTIGSGTTFGAATYTHTVNGDWINNGTFTAGTSTVSFSGSGSSSITGATTFSTMTVNKTAATTVVSLQNNVSAATVNMTNGQVATGANTLTITTNRIGNGIILGNIQRTHAFVTGTAYAFEGPQNTITFSSVSGVGSITVSVSKGSISGFPFGTAINRSYSITVPSGTYTATLRLHYEDEELNGNSESTLGAWDYNGSTWVSNGNSGNSTTSNYIDLAGLTNINLPWTLSNTPNVMQWTGAVSTDWNTAANWTVVQGTPGATPTSNDVVQIGTAAFTNQPSISTTANARSLLFGSSQAVTLTLNPGGTLTTAGNINGSWSGAATHTIDAGTQALTVNGDLVLSDGTAGHAINVNIGSGNVGVSGSVTESGGAGITFTGNGSLAIGEDFLYNSGTFTPGTGTVLYNGAGTQAIAGVTYNNLSVNKAGGLATINTTTNVQGDLSLTAGTLSLNAATAIAGNVTISAGATLNGNSVTTGVGGNWSNNGTFIPGDGTIQLNGTGAQAVSASTFNNLVVNKSGTATLGGNISINSDLTLSSGSLDIGTFTAARNSTGGSLNMSAGAVLLIGGAANFPANYATGNLAAGSTVSYTGTVAQSVAPITYGNLTFSNSGVKTLTGPTTVNGDITIFSGASLNADVNTLALGGNWNNSGTFIPATGTVLLNGASGTITGNTTFNGVTVSGTYTVAGSDIVYNGLLNITATGSFAAGSGTATVNGDLTNSGSLTSTGTTTFTGTTLQTIHLQNAIVSNSSGIINFNGNVSPVLSSTSTPIFANLNVNNTAGVNPSVNWTIFTSFTIGSGGVFNGGNLTHTIVGSFTNNGTVTSSGTLTFSPTTAVTVNVGSGLSSTGTIRFAGSGAITMAGTPAALQNVIISNTNAGGFTPSSGWTVNGNFSIASNAIFNAGSLAYTVAGDVESDGTLNGGASTFTLNAAAGLLSGSPGTTFHHLVLTGNITANSDFQVDGNFTDNGTFDASVGQLTMTGGATTTISGAASPLAIAQLGVEKTYGVPVTLAGNISSISSLHLSGGILDAGVFTLSQDITNGGDLFIDDSAVLRIGGTNTLPVFTTYTLDTLSTVDYAGSTQTITSTVPYGNLTLSASGTKTPAAALTVLNNFSLSNGSFAGGAFTHLVGGDWLMTSGSFVNTGTTIQLNGIDTQTVASTGAFSNLSINKTSGLATLGSDVTVNNTLNLTAGKLSLSNNNLTIGAAGTISGASSASYIVARGTGTLVQPVSSGGSRAFPVGTATNYIPATIALTAGSTADNISARVIDTVYIQGNDGTPVQSGAVNATWILGEGTPGGSNATVTLQWPGSLELPAFSRAACRLAHYTASAWDYGLTDLAATGSDPYTLSRSGVTSFSPFAVSGFGALPVTWLDVSGNNIGTDNYIHWSTAVETNNNYFAVEQSADGAGFTELGRVAGTNHSSGVQDYQFIHHDAPAGKNYYRIRQVDLDGRFSYSKTIVILTANVSTGYLYVTNPAYDRLTAAIQSTLSFATTVLVLDGGGKVLLAQHVDLHTGGNRVDLPTANLARGVYYLQYTDEQGNRQTRKFVKQ
jgi:hypothetical protein